MADDREDGKVLRRFFKRRAVQAIGAVALIAVVVALLFVFLNWYIAPTKASTRKDLILTLAQILGGIVLLSGLYFTWRTLQVNREGQITDRYTRAIDQLGKVNDEGKELFEIRIGGIYALERIARESAEDYWPIMEVLTAYVRQHARRLPKESQRGTENVVEKTKSEEDSGGSLRESDTAQVLPLRPDIQAIMTVLRRRTRSFNNGEPERLYLRETILSRANLWGANLSGAVLRGANLQEARLRKANLSGARLTKANLSSAFLIEANLSGANLSGAKLYGADLSGAVLTQEQLNETYGDETTQIPPTLKAPAHWSVKTNERIEWD